jgi:hypothetical protein
VSLRRLRREIRAATETVMAASPMVPSANKSPHGDAAVVEHTAPDRDAEARREIAAALHGHFTRAHSGHEQWECETAADAVWPVVERIRERARAEGAADALDEAAEASGSRNWRIGAWLHDRATALRSGDAG